jgi:Cys-rich four helix bundle protein (predicted Tat secretion target)
MVKQTAQHGQPSASDIVVPTQRMVVARVVAFGVAAAGSIFAIGRASAQTGHEGHDMNHMGHGAAGAPNQALIDAALTCVNRGDVCLQHCIKLLSTGDTSLKDCIRTVSVMLPLCETHARHAALEAPRLKDLAKLCADVCDDCEKECRKHEQHHVECKNCAQSCAACSKECRKLAGQFFCDCPVVS